MSLAQINETFEELETRLYEEAMRIENQTNLTTYEKVNKFREFEE